MPFCEECGNEINVGAKFCPNCGTKNKDKNKVKKIIKKKIKTPSQKINKSKKTDFTITSVIDEKDTEYLKIFFTVPTLFEDPEKVDHMSKIWQAVALFVIGIIAMTFGHNLFPEDEFWGWITKLGGLVWIVVSLAYLYEGLGIYYKLEKSNDEPEEKNIGLDGSVLTKKEKLHEWEHMSPKPLFRRLEQAQKIVAESSFEGLGIDRNAKPSEGGPIKDAAYTYGPHLDFLELVFGVVDKDGVGKGARYYKFCEDVEYEGLYTREYDMMVVQFTENQIMVYKCIFDILEMTKRLEESYEWNYKHVVGINIAGNNEEKKLSDTISVTGTKCMVISAASGDKIEIVLGADATEIVDGKK